MAATAKETLLAAETLTVDLNNTPEAFDLLATRSGAGRIRPRKLHALVYDPDDNLAYPPMVLTAVTPGPEGIALGVVGPLWHTGSNGIGPAAEERNYYSGQSKLSDGGFELGDLLYFKPAEGSTWTTSLDAHAGAMSAYHAADTDTDDPLAADEVFTARAGEQYTASVWVRRIAGAIGRLRLRLAFAGRFARADVLVHDWSNVSEFPGDMDETSPGVFRVGPNERKQILQNGSFEAGNLDYWRSLSGAWAASMAAARTGVWSVKIDGTTPAVFRQLISDAVPGGTDQGYDVLPGETWVIGAFLAPALADGKAWMNAMLGGVVGGVPNTPIQQQRSIEITDNAVTSGVWSLVAVEVQVPTDAVLPYLSISLVTEDHEVGTWHFDDIAIIRTVGNRGYLAGGTAWIFVPLRTYKWSAKVDGSTVFSGNVRFGLTLIGVGRPNLYVESQPHDVRSPDAVMELSFTPPSGYEYGSPVIITEDVLGGSFTLTDMHCYDQDTATVVVDTDSAASGGWAQLTRTFTAPVGTDSVHAEVIGEAGSGGWLADDLALTRTGVTLSTGDDIVADCLTQPETGEPLSLGPGTINCPEVIPYDLRIVNLTNRDLLEHYCTVVSDPPREFRCNATDPPTIDVATAAELFTTHPLAEAIRAPDPEVEDLSSPETDATDRPTHVKLIGATRRTLSGRDLLITSTAAVPGATEYDYNNRPIVRTKVVSRGTVDHLGYADAFVADLALRESDPALALSVKLSGLNARADVPPGDTIHVYRPESGLTAYPDNATTIDGEPAFPVPIRVLARERALGPGWRIVMRRPNGSTFPLPGVLWSAEDAVVLTLGDRLPDWEADPQGRSEGAQYLADRKSRPS